MVWLSLIYFLKIVLHYSSSNSSHGIIFDMITQRFSSLGFHSLDILKFSTVDFLDSFLGYIVQCSRRRGVQAFLLILDLFFALFFSLNPLISFLIRLSAFFSKPYIGTAMTKDLWYIVRIPTRTSNFGTGIV